MNDSELQPVVKNFGKEVVDVESLNDPILPSVDSINEHEHRVISLLTQESANLLQRRYTTASSKKT